MSGSSGASNFSKRAYSASSTPLSIKKAKPEAISSHTKKTITRQASEEMDDDDFDSPELNGTKSLYCTFVPLRENILGMAPSILII
jgi:hypothetical protein